ncbi:hypothetical protein TWF694_010094 [Orbilia ellipsospora]|uniref:Zn(2)-C6 fungal-type domain-containing protein n=1 Tax=Orbilia ellipsospora TaxID=2528407 RepID=A0AAV9X9B4_9PEZI
MRPAGPALKQDQLRTLLPSDHTCHRPPMVAKQIKRQRAKNACVSCKLLKSKCSEETPRCSNCQEAGTECVYQIETPGHRRDLIRTKHRQIHAEIEKYKTILQYIKNTSLPEVKRLLEVFKGPVSIEDILHFIKNDSNVHMYMYDSTSSISAKPFAGALVLPQETDPTPIKHRAAAARSALNTPAENQPNQIHPELLDSTSPLLTNMQSHALQPHWNSVAATEDELTSLFLTSYMTSTPQPQHSNLMGALELEALFNVMRPDEGHAQSCSPIPTNLDLGYLSADRGLRES